jgi:hypothetical protein
MTCEAFAAFRSPSSCLLPLGNRFPDSLRSIVRASLTKVEAEVKAEGWDAVG